MGLFGRLVVATLILAQLPMSAGFVMLSVGIALHGPGYLTTIETILRGGPPSEEDVATARARAGGGSAGSAKEAGQSWTAPPPRDALPPPPSREAKGPRRPVGELPRFILSSPLGTALTANAAVSVDYVSVAPQVRGAPQGRIVSLRFRAKAEPHVAALVTRTGLTWFLEGQLPSGLIGLIVVGDTHDDPGEIVGAPAALPVEAIVETANSKPPFVETALPDCRRDDGAALHCSDVTQAAPDSYVTKFDRAEAWAPATLGRPIASLSSSFADDRDARLLVPSEVITPAARRKAQALVDQFRDAAARQAQRKATLLSYARTWRDERRRDLLAMMEARPLLSAPDLAETQPSLAVVSVYEGDMPPAAPESITAVADYADFVARVRSHIPTVRVHVSPQRRTVLVLTSYRTVNWVIDVEDGGTLAGVEMHSFELPGDIHLPEGVPLVIRSQAFGDPQALGYLEPLGASPQRGSPRDVARRDAALTRLRAIYGATKVRFEAVYRTGEITVNVD